MRCAAWLPMAASAHGSSTAIGMEVTFEGRRAMILTGIDDLVRRHDLADRALVLNLQPISEEMRRGEEFHLLFEKEKPRVLWALLDALSVGLRERPNVHLSRLPRMAGFALFGTACERAIGLPPGGFMRAYGGNRSDALAQSVEGDAVALAVRDFFDALKVQSWEGSPTDLSLTGKCSTRRYSRAKVRGFARVVARSCLGGKR